MITNIYSKRQKRLRGECPDVYQYDNIPIVLRRQIIMVCQNVIGKESNDFINGYFAQSRLTTTLYNDIHNILCNEYGEFKLDSNSQTNSESIFNYFLHCNDYEKCIDIIELLLQHINLLHQKYIYQLPAEGVPQDAMNEVNYRFQEHGLGYQFEPDANEIIRVDSQLAHSEIVKPVLKLLANNDLYQGANDEFLSAHEHYRHQNYKESLNDCLKSFESFLKAIHEKRNWEYNKDKDTAQKLVQSCFDHDLIPKYMQTQFDSLGNLLKSGLPTTRNRESGHGQGTEVRNVPEHLASYALHLTATNLLFLAQCEAKL